MSETPKRWRRWLRRGVLALLGTVALAVLLVVGVVFTGVGTGVAIGTGLSWYAGTIPGDLTYEDSEGALAGGVTLRGVRAQDREGAVLFEAEHLHLGFDAGQLFGGVLDLQTIELEHARVHPEGAFEDLVSPGPAEPAEPSETLGPDLPLVVRGRVRLRDVELVDTVTVAALDLELEASGTRASVALDAAAAVSVAGLNVDGLSLRAHWDEPRAHVESLALQTSEGDVWLAGARADLQHLRFDIGSLRAEVNSPRLGSTPLTLAAQGGGSLAAMHVDASVSASGLGTASLLVDGGLAESPWASLLVDVSLLEVGAFPALDVDVQADVAGDLDAGLDADVAVRCDGCDTTLDPIAWNTWARVEQGASRVSARTRLESGSVSLTGRAMAAPDLGGGATVSLRIPRLDELAPLVQRFAPDLALRGAVTLDATCGGVVPLQFAGCSVRGAVEDGAPVDDAAFELTAAVAGERVEAWVHRLEVAQAAARVRQLGGPAHIDVGPEVVAVHDLALAVGTIGGMGRVSVGGQLGLGESGPVDAEVVVSSLPLAALDPIAPQLRARGTLSSRIQVAGTTAQPEVTARVSGRDLSVLAIALGDLDLDARTDTHAVYTQLNANGADLGTVALRAEVPLRGAALDGARPSSLDLDARGLRLRAAGRVVPSLASLDGELDLRVRHRGSLASPRVQAEVAVRGGVFDAHVLPEVDVRARFARRLLEVELGATHPEAFEQVSVQASAPLRLDLARGVAGLRSRAPLSAQVSVQGLDLGYGSRLSPDVQAQGVVSLDAALEGSARSLSVRATVHARSLAWAETEVGDVSMALGYGDGQATARAWAAGPAFSGLGVDATVPVLLDLTAPPRWDPTRPHALQVALNEALVGPVLQAVPGAPPLDLDARVDTLLRVSGPLTAPEVTVAVDATDIVYGGREVGVLDLDAQYVAERVEAEVTWNAARDRTAWVQAGVPLSIDVLGGTARWRQDELHQIRIAIPTVDRTLLAPFVDLGAFDGAFAVHALALGSMQDFEASASVRGNVRGRHGSLPMDVRVVAAPREQSLSVDLAGNAKVRARTEAYLPALLEGGDWKDSPLVAMADIDALELSTLAPFLPAGVVQGLQGQLDTHVEVEGPLGKPTFEGSLALRDGAVTVVPARVRLTNMQAASTFSDHGLSLDAFGFDAGDGRVSATGSVAVGAGLRSNVDLTVTKFPVRAPGLPRMALSTGVHTELFANLERTDVDVRVDETVVDVYATSIAAADPIPTNDRVVLADLSRPADDVPEAVALAAPSRTQNVRVAFEDGIRIIGPSIDMQWGGAVQANADPAGAKTSGKLEARRGSFSLLGSEFDLQQGTVYLAGEDGVVPFVDVLATTSIDDVEITATIRGVASRPEFELSSVPSLPQSEIFTILVTGTTDTQGADSDEVQDKAAAILAAMSNGALQRQLGERLRVDKIGVGFGDTTEQPILSVGKNITRDVYAETEYHHNAPQFENRAQLEVEYEFAPRWSLETFFGDAAQGGVDVFWGFAFD